MLTTNQYGKQEFNPATPKEAIGQISGFIRDAVRNFYTTGEGSPAGTTGRHSKSNALLNDIRGAVDNIEKGTGEVGGVAPLTGRGKSKVGGKGKSTSKTIDFTNPQEVADYLNNTVYPARFKAAQERFAAGNLKNEPKLKEVTPGQVQEAIALENQFEGDLGAPTEEGTNILDEVPTEISEQAETALDGLRSEGGNRLTKALGLDEATIQDLSNQIEEVVAQDIPDFKKDSRIGAIVADKLTAKGIESNINTIVRSATLDDVPSAKKLKSYIQDNYIDNITGRSKPQRDLRNFVGRFVGAEIEGNNIASRAGKTIPSPEFSLENRNPKFSGFEFDAGRTTSQRVESAVTPFLENSKRNLRGDKFSSILTHRSPEKKAAVKRAAKKVGASIVDHPLNPGEVLVLPKGKTLNDVLKFNTSRNGKAVDLDPRDFTRFNESATPDARQYTDLNINDLLNNINNRSNYLNNNNNWGKLNKITQLKPDDLNNAKRALIEEGFNVQESVDAKGDPTLVFSKGKIDPNWSLDDVHAPAKELSPNNWNKELAKILQDNFPNTDVIATQDGFNDYANELVRQGVNLPQGIKGLQHGNKIVINPLQSTKDTAIHEFGHIWAKQLQRDNPKLWKRGVELLKGTPYMRVVADNPHYRAYLDSGNPSRFYEEVMANALGKRGAEIFAQNREKAGVWDKFRTKVGSWLKNKLGIASEKDYADLTLGDWLDIGAHSILTGDQTAFQAPVSKEPVNYSIAEANETAKRNPAKDYAEGMKSEPKWYKPKDWGRLLVPPAADDYHGLLQRAGLEKHAKAATDAFVRNHHAYVKASTATREAVAKHENALKKAGVKLSAKNVATIGGQKLNAAQAIQAHVDGHPTVFSKRPAVQKYIQNMTELGVLKPERDQEQGYLSANPLFDVVDYIANDLYQTNFQEFNAERANIFDEAGLKKIAKKSGQSVADALSKATDRMATGKSSGFTDPTVGPWNDFLLGSVGVTMFFNGRSAALQTISSLNYGFESKNPMRFAFELAKTMPSALTGKNKDFNKLWNSPYLKERRARAGVDVTIQEMADLAAGGSYSNFTKKLLNFGFKATTLADSFAIASGGVAMMKTNGVKIDPNDKKWIESSEEAQQSSRPDRVSNWQAGSVAKYVLAFANTPQQYFRLSQKALRSIKQGKDVKKNVGKLIYYMAAQNAIFTTLQGATYALVPGIEDDKETEDALDAVNSISESILRGMGLYGAIINTIKNIAVEGYKQEEFKRRPDHVKTFMKALTISPPLQHKIRNLEGAGKALTKGEYGTALAKTGAVANLPTDWALKKYNAAKEINDDKYTEFQKALLLLGWSEYNFDYGK